MHTTHGAVAHKPIQRRERESEKRKERERKKTRERERERQSERQTDRQREGWVSAIMIAPLCVFNKTKCIVMGSMSTSQAAQALLFVKMCLL